jgi:hypothetical protein
MRATLELTPFAGEPALMDVIDSRRMVDKHGLTDVLVTLESLCDAKADHVAENWQDRQYARLWRRVAVKLGLAVVASREV